MRRRTPFTWLAAMIALVGLCASSTLIAYAAMCSDGCPMREAAAHACCPSEPELELPAGPRIGEVACCDRQTVSCGSPVMVPREDALCAADQGERAAALAVEIVRELPLPRPTAVATAPPPPKLHRPALARTIVLQL